MDITIEVCCGTYYDAINAAKGGADRIELTSSIYLGGLTPSVSSLKLIKENTDLEVASMVRQRGAGFSYNEIEFTCMYEEAKDLLENGTDAIVFGFLNNDFTINQFYTEKMVNLSHKYNREAVFHKAFDITSHDEKALQTLIDLGVDRVLTSGGKSSAIEGKDNLKKLFSYSKGKIEILAGGGVNSTNALELIKYTGVKEIHSSCRDWEKDITTSNGNISYDYASFNHTDMYEIVSLNKVKQLKKAILSL